MSSNTPNLNLYLPAVGDGAQNSATWGLQVNNNFAILDGVVAGLGMVRSSQVFTATQGQTLFTGITAYVLGYGAIALYLNGSRLYPADFTETSTTSVTLAAGCQAGDVLLVAAGQTGGLSVPAGNVSYLAPYTGAGGITQAAKNNEGSVCVLDFYANGSSGAMVDPTGALDSTLGMNAAAAAAKAAGKPLYVPAGTYTMSAGWNLTGAGNGWKVYGDGRSKTIINITVPNARAAIEGLNSRYLHMEDMSIYALGNNATAVVLVGGTTSTGDHFLAENCHFETASTACLGTVVVNSSDLSILRRCWLYGQNACVNYSLNNGIGMVAAYGTLCSASGQMTKGTLDACAVTPSTGKAIVWDVGSDFHAKDTYFGMTGTSVAVVYLSTAGNGLNVNLDNCRVEAPSSNLVDIILFGTNTTVSSCGRITGVYNHTGSVFNGPSGAVAQEFDASGWFVTSTAYILKGGMDVRFSRINNMQSIHATLGTNSYGNTIYGYDQYNEWIAGANNTIVEYNQTVSSGPLLLQGPDNLHILRLIGASGQLDLSAYINGTYGSLIAGQGAYPLSIVGNTLRFCASAGVGTPYQTVDASGNVTFKAQIGFNNTAAIAKPTVTGSKGANAALASLLTALANYGLITDSST